ncbi:hypothetical protein CW304_28005 [Bacillus sp. UFRGS-B20]|nr:hypothetical protein CW304_28005 [Bacillus sp. UFRGS-B20]
MGTLGVVKALAPIGLALVLVVIAGGSIMIKQVMIMMRVEILLLKLVAQKTEWNNRQSLNICLKKI